MSVQRVDPSEWTLAACGAFFRVENTIVLEARSILYAVQYVESNYPLGRFLTFSDNPTLLLALCKGRPNTFTLLSVMRRIFVSGFATGFVLSFRLIPSIIPTREVVSLTVIMTRANHFFMIWHSAQTQSSPAQTCDRDCLSPSLTHLDAGTADLATHVRVAAVSHVPSDDLSNYTGHAAAVSSQRSSVNGKNNCISSLTSQGSFAPMTFVGYLWVWLNRNFWMNRRCSGPQLILIQNLVTHEVPRRSLKNAHITRLLAAPPHATRPSRVSFCQIRCPTPESVSFLNNVAVSKSLVELARDVARVQGQPAGKEEDSETSGENGPMLVPKSAQVVFGRRRSCLWMLVDHFMC